MITEIQNNFINLDYLYTSLVKNPPDQNKLEERIDRIRRVLFQLKSALSPFTMAFAKEWAPILEGLSGRIETFKAGNHKVTQLIDEIFNLKVEIDRAPLQENQTIYRSKIDFKWMIFLDMDFPDDSGSLCRSIAYYFDRKVPLITTRSILSAHHIDDEKTRIAIRKELEAAVFRAHSEWTIYQQYDPKYGNELIVFLPKRFNQENLESFDLAADGSLTIISALEAFQEPERKASIEAFYNLFSTSPKLNAVAFWEGHGLPNRVGGLFAHNVLNTLDFFKRQKFKGVVVSSCYFGGESSLIPLSKREPVFAFNQNRLDMRSFPIIMRSIGDFEVYGGQAAEKNIDLFLDEFAIFLENEDQTLSKLRHVFNRLEKGFETKHPFNLAKVNFIHTSHSAEGFRPIGESNQGESLTYVAAKRNQLFASLLSINKTYLHLHPQVVSASIEWNSLDCILHSMIPGNGRHLLRSLKLSSISAEDFIKKMRVAYDDFDHLKLACKGFFIGSLQSKIDWDNNLSEVIIYTFPFSKTRCIYRKKEKYYLTDGETTCPLTPFQHALYVKEVERRTRPKAEALRLSTGGQEEIEDFEDALRSLTFYLEESQSLKCLLDFETTTKTPQSLKKWVDAYPLAVDDKVQLVLALEEMKFFDLSLQLYQEMHFDGNAKNFSRIPFIILASMNENLPLVKELIKQKVNINVMNALDDLNSPMHYACLSKNPDLLDALLDSEEIDWKLKNFDPTNKKGRGWTALSFTLPDKIPFLVKILEKKGCELLADPLGQCLKEVVSYYSLEKLKVLLTILKAAKIVNGDFLKSVFQHNNWNLFKILTDKVEVVTEGKEENQILSFGIRYAALYSSAKVFKELLAKYKNDLRVDEGLKYAFFSGSREKIEAIKGWQIHFNKEDHPLLDLLFSRYEALEDFEQIKALRHWNTVPSPVLEKFIVDRYSLRRLVLSRSDHLASVPL